MQLCIFCLFRYSWLSFPSIVICVHARDVDLQWCFPQVQVFTKHLQTDASWSCWVSVTSRILRIHLGVLATGQDLWHQWQNANLQNADHAMGSVRSMHLWVKMMTGLWLTSLSHIIIAEHFRLGWVEAAASIVCTCWSVVLAIAACGGLPLWQHLKTAKTPGVRSGGPEIAFPPGHVMIYRRHASSGPIDTT